MSRLIECRSCGGLVPKKRPSCPHCGRGFRLLPRTATGGIAAAIGLGASLAGCGAPMPPSPDSGTLMDDGGAPLADSGPLPGPEDAGHEDAGHMPVADYGIVAMPDGGPEHHDAGSDEDAGHMPVADYGIVAMPDGGGPEPADAGPQDAGHMPMADYGIVGMFDAGHDEADAGEDGGHVPTADYGIVSMPDGGTR